MGTTILMNVLDSQEMRVGIVRDGTLEALVHERANGDGQHLGNIYKARVANVEPSLDAAFIDLGAGKNGFIHVDEVLREKGGGGRIEQVLKPGQEILVQITKEAIRDKGPCLSMYLSLPGRCLVLVRDGGRTGGVSRKIEDGAERRRLRSVLDGLAAPEDFGFIIRTAGAACSDDEIRLDHEYLMRLWTEITARAERVKAPACLYEEGHLILRTLRDVVSPDVEAVVIDQADLYDEARAFAQVFLPELAPKIQLHRESLPLFTFYNVEARLASVFDKRVELPSGGNIVIEQTEALVSIDVNSSKNKESKNVEATALMTNLEAVQVIAEQLRLRDLGGLIILDFIDMEDRDHQRLVQLALRKALLRDKARTAVGPMSRFGLIEMTRQRTRPSHGIVSQSECPYCHGTGQIRTAETFEINALRAVRELLADQGPSRLEVVVPQDLAVGLLNTRRKELAQLEDEHDCRIVVMGDVLMKAREFRLVPGDRRGGGGGRRRKAERERPVRPSLLAPLLEQQARQIAEAKALAKRKVGELEREVEAAENGTPLTAPAAPSGEAPRPATGPVPAVAAPRPTTLWDEAGELRALLFTRPVPRAVTAATKDRPADPAPSGRQPAGALAGGKKPATNPARNGGRGRRRRR